MASIELVITDLVNCSFASKKVVKTQVCIMQVNLSKPFHRACIH
jgi:hypothetical protein